MSCGTALFILLFPYVVFGKEILNLEEGKEARRTKMVVDLVTFNLNPNGWTNILAVGNLPKPFYFLMKNAIGSNVTFSIIVPDQNDHNLGEVNPSYSNIVILDCMNFKEFEDVFRKAMSSPYWHPHSRLILYYHVDGQADIPQIFMIFWFYNVCNAIIVQYNDVEEAMLLSYYSPYISENYKLNYEFGCWKATKLNRPVRKLIDSFVCVEGCLNITLHSTLRSRHLGTCIGIQTLKVLYGDTEELKKLNLFKDKSKNLHGFVLRAFADEVLPFLSFKENNDGSLTYGSRDGMIWSTAAELMNFRIDLNASKATIKKPFNFDRNIQQIYTFARREADLILFPIYQFDIIFVEIDLSIPFKDSGVCIVSHRAGFETVIFNSNLLYDNTQLFIRFVLCFDLIWLLFFVFSVTEKGTISFDQAGKDLINTIRNVLSITLYKPPKWESFKIYLAVSIWSFFVINFATQAAIISFFSAYKRGREVNTFEDVIDKGYMVQGMASPDMMLPDTEETFRKMNSKLVSVTNLFECVDGMLNDSRRFCLIDCSVAHYLANNRLNEKGEQYLHIASKDRIHAHYLVMIFPKFSLLRNTFNKYLRIFFEAGLIWKWEKYRFSNVKPEVPVKALSLKDLSGIFKCYCLLLALSSTIFVIEILISSLYHLEKYIIKKISNWKRTRTAKEKLKERKLGKIKLVHQTYSQTV